MSEIYGNQVQLGASGQKSLNCVISFPTGYSCYYTAHGQRVTCPHTTGLWTFTLSSEDALSGITIYAEQNAKYQVFDTLRYNDVSEQMETNLNLPIETIVGKIFYVLNADGYFFYDSTGNTTNVYADIVKFRKKTSVSAMNVWCFYNQNICPYGSGTYKWSTSNITEGCSLDFGTGSSNTEKLLSKYGSNTQTMWPTIKTYIRTNGIGGKKDWFIGSRGEVEYLRQELLKSGSLETYYFVTSSESSAQYTPIYFGPSDKQYWSDVAKTSPFNGYTIFPMRRV